MTLKKPMKMARFQFTTDAAFAVFGCGLAVASASFGVYMTVSGNPSSLGKSQDFSVFAQLAGHSEDRAATHVPTRNAEDLDLTATASIPKGTRAGSDKSSDAVGASTIVVPGIILQTAGTDAAEVTIDGRLQRVRVGDLIPGAGEVLAIYPGQHPMLKTSRGLVVP